MRWFVRTLRFASWLGVVCLGFAPSLASGVTAPVASRDSAAIPSVRATPGAPTLQQVLEHADSLVKARGGPRAENARIYLSWNAPWGMPGARRTRHPHARDSRTADTLYLSFLPGRTSVGFTAFSADLYIRSAPGETLGTYWHMERGAIGNSELTVECGPDSTFPGRQPWVVTGARVVKFDRTPQSAHLLVWYAVPYSQAVPVIPDSIYTLGRLVFHHHKDLPGSAQPVCIEWAMAELDYWLKDGPTVNRGERFVSYTPDESVCDVFRSSTSEAAPAPPKPAQVPRPVRRALQRRTR